ncbi:hypothetical protein NITLEN_20063 [Nitrospira lenta]|uniref:Uncharacterized protein n=1 Tax=Nitrospira lenta TaxID=1436998 RepID=A0A330L3M1_9BACT|nr:hypothetical protein NITLEN_20063 [Nitrospira lenta]
MSLERGCDSSRATTKAYKCGAGPITRLRGFGEHAIPVQGLNQFHQLCLRLLIDIRKLHAHSWKEKMALWSIPCPGDLAFGFDLLPGPIRQGKFHRYFRSGSERGAAFNEESASADAAGQAIELFPFGSGIADFQCKRGSRVCAAMGKARIVITRQELINDGSPGDASEEGVSGIVDQNHFLMGVDHEVFPLVIRGAGDGVFHA